MSTQSTELTDVYGQHGQGECNKGISQCVFCILASVSLVPSPSHRMHQISSYFIPALHSAAHRCYTLLIHPATDGS